MHHDVPGAGLGCAKVADLVFQVALVGPAVVVLQCRLAAVTHVQVGIAAGDPGQGNPKVCRTRRDFHAVVKVFTLGAAQARARYAVLQQVVRGAVADNNGGRALTLQARAISDAQGDRVNACACVAVADAGARALCAVAKVPGVGNYAVRVRGARAVKLNRQRGNAGSWRHQKSGNRRCIDSRFRNYNRRGRRSCVTCIVRHGQFYRIGTSRGKDMLRTCACCGSTVTKVPSVTCDRAITI